jgi:hypothetical protein
LERFIEVHTHPLVTDITDLGSFATRLLDTPRRRIPSRDDVESISHYVFGIVVPVNIVTREIELVAYQPYNNLSYVAYENLFEEVGRGPDAERILELARERSILRTIKFDKRKGRIFTVPEIDLMLRTFDFSWAETFLSEQ